MTPAMPVQCSTNCATKVLGWKQVNLWGSLVPVKGLVENKIKPPDFFGCLEETIIIAELYCPVKCEDNYSLHFVYNPHLKSVQLFLIIQNKFSFRNRLANTQTCFQGFSPAVKSPGNAPGWLRLCPNLPGPNFINNRFHVVVRLFNNRQITDDVKMS